jgi:sphingolipid delta-4 desaturase
MSSIPDFTRSDRSEPHRLRRRAIIKAHPEIQRLFGYDPKAAYIILGVALLQLGVAATVPNRCLWLILIAYCIGAALNHWLAMGIHECSHHLSARTGLQNRWVALLANIPMVVPGAMSFWRGHLSHHAHLGVERLDNDLPVPVEVRWVGRSTARKMLWYFFFLPVTSLTRNFLRRPDRWELLNFALQMSVNLAIWRFLGSSALVYLSLSTFFGMGLHPVAGHLVHEHYSFTGDGQETYSYYGPLNAVAFNVGYHNEHHDFMGIPGSRLPELRRIAAEYYGKLESHDSWTSVIWRFLTDSEMGNFSRITRRSGQRVAAASP